MEDDPKDQIIIDLLAKLKNATREEYPRKLLASRRNQYLNYAAHLGFGVGIGAKMMSALKGGNGKAVVQSQVKSKLLETVLAVAIVAEAGTLAYFYRDKIADLIQPTPSASPSVEEVTPAPDSSSPLPQITPTALETPTPPMATPTIILTSTPLPAGTAGNENVRENAQLTSTPNPNDNGNNGNHYGQTPKPERTKKSDKDGKPTKEPKDPKKKKK